MLQIIDHERDFKSGHTIQKIVTLIYDTDINIFRIGRGYARLFYELKEGEIIGKRYVANNPLIAFLGIKSVNISKIRKGTWTEDLKSATKLDITNPNNVRLLKLLAMENDAVPTIARWPIGRGATRYSIPNHFLMYVWFTRKKYHFTDGMWSLEDKENSWVNNILANQTL